MRHPPVTDEQMKFNKPLWKRMFSFSNPEWTPMKLSVVVLMLVTLVLVSLTFYPTESTRDFEAATVQTADFELSNMKLSAYESMKFTLKKSSGVISDPNRSSSSDTISSFNPDGGMLLKGTVKNISDRELFFTTAYAEGLSRSNPIGVRLSTNNNPNLYHAEVEFDNATYSINNDGITGYYLKPNERFDFKMITTDLKINSNETVEIEIEWQLIDPATLERIQALALPVFEETGSSAIRGDAEIYWKRQRLERR